MSRLPLTQRYPQPYGYSKALENVGTSAAPLLAGFSIALIGLTVDRQGDVGQPDLALLLLVAAALLLIAAVQFAFTAREYYVEPGDVEAIESLAVEGSEKPAEAQAQEREVIEWCLDEHARWLGRTRHSYNAGIVLLLLGVATTLTPKGPLLDAPPLRVMTVVLVVAGAVAEALWTLVPIVRQRLIRRREMWGSAA